MRSALLLLVAAVGVAQTAPASKSFDAPAAKVFAAAHDSIASRGVVLDSDADNGYYTFLVGKVRGRLNITAIGDKSAIVTVEIEDPKHGTQNEAAILDGMALSLDGKPVPEDRGLRAKAWGASQKMERQHAEARIAAMPPAGATISADSAAVKSAIISECAAHGFAISSETDHQVTVFRDVPAGTVVGFLLLGNAAPQSGRISIQFMLSGQGNATEVNVAADEVLQNGYGRTTRLVLTDTPDAKQTLQALLDRVKAKVEQQPNR